MTNFEDLREMLLFEILDILAKEGRLAKVKAKESSLIPLQLLGKEELAITKDLKGRGFQLSAKGGPSHGLCLTELTFGRLSRVANLAPQDWQEELIISHLWSKNPVFVSRKGCQYRQQLGAAPFKVQQKIREWEANLEAFGVIFLKETKVPKEANVLTAAKVQEQLKKGNVNFEGDSQRIVTPLARELIADYHRLNRNQK